MIKEHIQVGTIDEPITGRKLLHLALLTEVPGQSPQVTPFIPLQHLSVLVKVLVDLLANPKVLEQLQSQSKPVDLPNAPTNGAISQ